MPLVLTLALLQSPFTVSGIFPTHFAVLIWLPAAIIALAAHHLFKKPGYSNLPGQAKPGFYSRIVLILLLLSLLARDLGVDLAYHRFLTASGGLGPHSDALYRLKDALAALPPGTPLGAMDWGFAPQLRYLSSETLAPTEVSGYALNPDPDFPARTEALLARPGAVFIFHWPQETIFPRREAFEAVLARRGLRAEVLQDVSRRDGAPVFQLVIVTRPER